MRDCVSLLKIPKLALALSLVLWVAVAGCLFGCPQMMAAPMSESIGTARTATVVSGESCGKTPNHDCCAKHGPSARPQQAPPTRFAPGPKTISAEAATALLPTFDGTTKMCPLALNATALATNARPVESPALLLSPVSPEHGAAGLTLAYSPFPAHFSNRGHTYLRCCVFLI